MFGYLWKMKLVGDIFRLLMIYSMGIALPSEDDGDDDDDDDDDGDDDEDDDEEEEDNDVN